MQDKQIVFIEEKVKELNNGQLISLMVDFDLFHLESDSDHIVLDRQELIHQLLSTTLNYDTVSRYNCSPDEEGHGNYVLDVWDDCWKYTSPLMDWKKLGEMWQKMLEEQKNVYITIEGKEYTVWWIEPGDEQIDLTPADSEVYGEPGVEMLVSDFTLLSLGEGWAGDEYIPLVFETVLKKENWVPVIYVEIETGDSRTTCMKIVKEGDKLPENATGRYLKTGNGGFEFK